MPIFEYKCQNCGNIFELLVLNRKKNNNLHCKSCGSKEVNKIISPVGIIFKGSGFYVNDTKSAKKSGIDISSDKKEPSNGNSEVKENKETASKETANTNKEKVSN